MIQFHKLLFKPPVFLLSNNILILQYHNSICQYPYKISIVCSFSTYGIYDYIFVYYEIVNIAILKNCTKLYCLMAHRCDVNYTYIVFQSVQNNLD